MSIYDDPSLRSGEFQSWDNPGESLIGDVVDVARGSDFNGNACVQLAVRTDDGDDVRWNVAQANARAQIMDLRPEVGDRIKIVFARLEKAEKGQKKVFEIAVTKGGAKGTVAASVDEEPF